MSASKTEEELKTLEDRDGHTANSVPRSCRSGKKRRFQDDSNSSDVLAATIAFADDVRCPFQMPPAVLKNPKAFGGYFDRNNPPRRLNMQLNFEYLRTLPSKDLLPWALNLTKANMAQFYNACPGWSWSDRKKKAELKHGKARFLVATAAGGEQSAMVDHVRRPVGFVHMRYEIERDKPVLYIYEFQVEPDYQGLGLGQSMLTWIEALARLLNLRSLMLTVFTANAAAFRFYKKAGFTLDQDSPGVVDLERSHGYEILSKAVV